MHIETARKRITTGTCAADDRVGARRASVGLLAAFLALALGLGAGSASAQLAQRPAMLDPELVVTAERCNACHGSEYVVWKETKHATGYDTMHRRESAERISAAMGEKLVKRESVCLQCHYTPEEKRGSLRARSGVSCESCHGAARDWINIHNNHGEGLTHDTEAPEHREMRIKESRANGMRRPSDLYDLAAACFQCHTVPHERLVNVGGHSAGSDFELVDRTGKIRHNFLESLLHGSGDQNAEQTPERKRRMYVAGRALDLEYTLRAISRATEDGVYLKALSRRLRNAERQLAAIQPHVPEVGEMLALAHELRAAPGREQEFLGAAELIASLNKAFLQRDDGSGLEALDPLISGEAPATLAGSVPGSDQETAGGGGGSQPAGGAGEVAAGGAATGGTGGSVQPVAVKAAPGAPAAPAEYGPVKSHLDAVHPAPSRGTVGATECGRCHGPQSGWWFADRHSTAAEPFFGAEPKNVQIARAYGITADAMRSGTAVCMDCHSGRGSHDVLDGVSCESCHGAGADYLKPHEEGDKSLGLNRPGYAKGLQAGMIELKKLETRAQTCASCHYVTDARLLWAGHPSGANYDFVASNQKIKHWNTPLADAGQLRAAWDAAIRQRGPIPKVEPVRLEVVAASSSRPAASSSSGAAGGPRSPSPGSRGSSSPSAASPTGLPAVAINVEHIELSPFPAISDSMAVDDVLAVLKQRIDYLYETLGASR